MLPLSPKLEILPWMKDTVGREGETKIAWKQFVRFLSFSEDLTTEILLGKCVCGHNGGHLRTKW